MIDFVHHQMPVALAGSLGEAGQLVTLEHCTRGVGRRGHQGTDSVFVPVAVDQVGRQLIIDVRPYRYQLRPTFDQTQEVAVARVAGVGQQPVLARIDQQTAGQQQRTGSARGDEDPFRVDAHPVALVVETCNRLAQGGQAAGRGVAGVARGQGRLPAATMGVAVVKSGSPISRWMTSWPAACSSLARASNAMTWKGSIARLRAL